MKSINSATLILLFSLFAYTACKKQKLVPQFTITGKLLESVTNPVPVKMYNLNLYRKERSGFTGSVPGISQNFKTDNNGNFSVTYKAEKGTGFASIGYSEESLSIYGIDSVLYRNAYVGWSKIPANKDTSLNTVYIY